MYFTHETPAEWRFGSLIHETRSIWQVNRMGMGVSLQWLTDEPAGGVTGRKLHPRPRRLRHITAPYVPPVCLCRRVPGRSPADTRALSRGFSPASSSLPDRTVRC